MENLLDRKLRLGIAACQYGARVRYNGKGIDLTKFLGRDRNEFIWTPVCPEAMSGMGIPRPSIKLSNGNGYDFWEGKATIKNKEGENKDEMVRKGALSCMETLERANIDAYVYMEGSPSCGIERTTLKNQRKGNPPGVFGALLLKKNMFLINSIDLQSPVRWWDWKRRLVAFTWIKEKNVDTLEILKEIWDKVKYMCFELHEEDTLKLRNKIRETRKKMIVEKDEINSLKIELMDILRKPAELENIKKCLWINYVDLKKREGVEVEEVSKPDALRNMTHIAQELLGVEIEARKKDLLFRSSPINYKPGR